MVAAEGHHTSANISQCIRRATQHMRHLQFVYRRRCTISHIVCALFILCSLNWKVIKKNSEPMWMQMTWLISEFIFFVFFLHIVKISWIFILIRSQKRKKNTCFNWMKVIYFIFFLAVVEFPGNRSGFNAQWFEVNATKIYSTTSIVSNRINHTFWVSTHHQFLYP